MPCGDGGVPYPITREEALDALAPKFLCAFVRVLRDNDALGEMAKNIDWKEAGVSKADFIEWDKLHQERDRKRREAQKADLGGSMKKGVSEPMDVRLTHFIVVAENHWAKGESLEAAKQAYKKVRGKPFPAPTKAKPNGQRPTFTIWGCTPETRIDDMGGFNYNRGDPMPVKLEEREYDRK